MSPGLILLLICLGLYALFYVVMAAVAVCSTWDTVERDRKAGFYFPRPRSKK